MNFRHFFSNCVSNTLRRGQSITVDICPVVPNCHNTVPAHDEDIEKIAQLPSPHLLTSILRNPGTASMCVNYRAVVVGIPLTSRCSKHTLRQC